MGLFEKKIEQFPQIIDWVNSLDTTVISNIFFSSDKPKLLMGSGGSYSAAAYGELLSVDKGLMAHAMTPYFYINSGFCRIPSDVILISASGSNNDITRAFDRAVEFKENHVHALTLTEKGFLQDRFQKNYLVNNGNIDCVSETPCGSLLSYNLPTGREGFLSTTSIVAFYMLLFRGFGYELPTDFTTKITSEEQNVIDEFVSHLKRVSLDELTQHEAYLHKLEGIDSFFILYSPSTSAATLDLESKFSEGALGNTQLADFRNFAHGRFNWFTQRKGQTGLICLAAPSDLDITDEIISKVPEFVPALRLTTKYDHPLASLDLLIKGHYLCSSLGARWGLDLSRPVVPDYGRDLYRR